MSLAFSKSRADGSDMRGLLDAACPLLLAVVLDCSTGHSLDSASRWLLSVPGSVTRARLVRFELSAGTSFRRFRSLLCVGLALLLDGDPTGGLSALTGETGFAVN